MVAGHPIDLAQGDPRHIFGRRYSAQVLFLASRPA